MKRFLAMLLAVVMVFALAACGQQAAPAPAPAEEAPAAEAPAAEAPVEAAPSANETTPLVVGYSPFNSKFSPFFSETAYDQDVQAMTQIGLLTSDRTGAIIQKGIEG